MSATAGAESAELSDDSDALACNKEVAASDDATSAAESDDDARATKALAKQARSRRVLEKSRSLEEAPAQHS